MLCIVDHGSRTCLCLERLNNKSSLTLLRYLFRTVHKYGKPKKIVTDNDAVFVSWLLNAGITLLGTKHHTTDVACPWQNGRVERFFLSFKQKANQLLFADGQQLALALADFQFWYNRVRPHAHLQNRTPGEVWHGADVFRQGLRKETWFDAWDGILAGYYLQT